MQARQEHNRPASLPLPPPRHKQQTVVPSFLISLCLFFKDVTKDETSMEEYFDIGGWKNINRMEQNGVENVMVICTEENCRIQDRKSWRW